MNIKNDSTASYVPVESSTRILSVLLKRASDSVSTEAELNLLPEGTILRTFEEDQNVSISVAVRENNDAVRDEQIWLVAGSNTSHASAELLLTSQKWVITHLPQEDKRVNKYALMNQVGSKLRTLSSRYESIDADGQPLPTGEVTELPYLFDEIALNLEVSDELLGSNEVVRYVENSVKNAVSATVYDAFIDELLTIDVSTFWNVQD